MTDWQNPETLLLSARAFVLFCHVVFGIYLWEFLISLDFDWAFWTGKEKWRWTYVPYFLTRYTALAALILAVRITNALSPMDCQPWAYAIYSLAHTSLGFASLLLLLRVVAVSGKNLLVMIFLGVFYLVNWAFLIRGITLAKGEAVYLATLQTCGVLHTRAHQTNVYITFGFDLACSVLLIVFLMRNRGSGLWRTLLTQGIVYFLLATLSYLMSGIFLTINLNDPINVIPEVACMATMSICATRMYRALFRAVANARPTPSGTSASDTIMGSGLHPRPRTLPQSVTQTAGDIGRFPSKKSEHSGEHEVWELGHV